jgi:hypothetical protein
MILMKCRTTANWFWFAAWLLVIPGAARAGVMLSELLTPGSFIIVDDKKFDNWTIEIDNGSVPVNVEDIIVDGLLDDPATLEPDPGLKFTAQNNALTVQGGDFINFAFSFKVTVLDPNRMIKDASLELTDFVFDAFTDSVVTIDDFVVDPLFVGLGALSVDADPFFGNLYDQVGFANQSMVFQEIDIFIDSGFGGAVTGINMFEVRKSQVSEPSSVALNAVALVGLLLVRLRTRCIRSADMR